MELTYCQERTKNKILQKISDFFHNYEENQIQNLWLEAPTGSGKTLIIARIIEGIIKKQNNTAVIFFTISQGNLPSQVVEKFTKYGVEFPHIYIASPSTTKKIVSDQTINLIAHKNYTYLIGISTLRNKAIIKNYFNNFIEDLSVQNNNLVVIWDEAHIGSRKNSQFNQTVTTVIQKYFTGKSHKLFTLKSTATIPKIDLCQNQNDSLIQITTSDAEEDNLIKSEQKVIIEDDQHYTYEALINKTLEKFKIVQKNYQKQQLNIRPAILVRIPTKSTKQPEEWDDHLNQLKKIIEDHNLTWAVWTSNEKELSPNLRHIKITTNYLSAPTCEVDVIIFIYALGTGYDIPRACFLLQLKELSSEILSTQILGRIKRNPTPDLRKIKGTIYDKYYVYSNIKEDIKIIFQRKPEYKKFTIKTVQWNEQEIKKAKQLSSKNINNFLNYFFKEKNKKIIENYKKDNFGLNLINNKDSTVKLQVSYYNDPKTYEIIFNLLHLKKIWNECAFNNKELKKIVEKWIIQKPIPKIFDYVWYCFFLDQKNQWIVREIKQKMKEDNNKHQQFFKLCTTESKSIKEKIILLNSRQTQNNLKVESSDWLNNFPYYEKSKEEHNCTREKQDAQLINIPLDSETEEARLEKWWSTLHQLQQNKQVKKLTICKNFKTLNISYPVIEQNRNLSSKARHYPDVWVRFYCHNAINQLIEYTLIIEFKSYHQSDKLYINSEEYQNKIEKIKYSYPILSEKVTSTKQYYFFILDVSANQNSINVWFKNKNIYQGTDIKKALEYMINQSIL